MVNKKLLEFDEELNSETKEINKQNNTQDNLYIEDSGYELDDSGRIPKLEELKAAGSKHIHEEVDDFEKDYDFAALDYLDDDNILDNMKFFDSEDLLPTDDYGEEIDSKDKNFLASRSLRDEFDDFDDIEKDLQNMKINFYDELDETQVKLDKIIDDMKEIDRKISLKDELEYKLDQLIKNTDRIAYAIESIAELMKDDRE